MNIKQIIKGIIIGIAKIIPGLSGAVLMISFNLYDRAIKAITDFFEDPKKNFIFLTNLGLGIILGIILFSKVIYFLISNYYLYTTSLFLGLIIGGIPIILKTIYLKKIYFILTLISFIVILSLSFLGTNQEYILKNTYIDFIVFFGAGLLEAVGTILPGISSTALLMIVGLYNRYLIAISNILNICYIKETLKFIIPFTLGMIVGIITLSILINYLFAHYKKQAFASILGVSIASIIMLSKTLLPYITNPIKLPVALIIAVIGFIITSKLEQ